MSDLLQLPMDRAAVTRIDIAQNFIMRHDKTVYFEHLGGLQYFNLPELRASLLYDPAFYTDIVNRWSSEYEKIKKINDIQINYSMIKTKKDQANQAILFYVNQRGGELAVINEIREAYKRGELSKKQAHHLRQQVEGACKCESFTYSSYVILE